MTLRVFKAVALAFLVGAASGGIAVAVLLRKYAPPVVVAAPRAPASVPAPGPAAPVALPDNSPMDAGPPTETAAATETIVPSTETSMIQSEEPVVPTLTAVKSDSTRPTQGIESTSLAIPVAGIRKRQLRDTFNESRGSRVHRAIDIMAARGTPVLAVIDGPVGKLFLSKPGGITLYQYDPKKEWIYYYAHLEGYAPGIAEGRLLTKGEVLGYVGTTGNAPPGAPHLHFSIEKLQTPGRWWKSDPVNPYPLFMQHGVTFEKR